MDQPTSDDRTEVRGLAWRVGLVYPALFVGPIVVLCLLIALRGGSDLNDVA